MIATAQREQRDRAIGQVGLFDLAAVSGAGPGASAPSGLGVGGERGEASRRELLGWEKELLGIYLSEHPLQDLAPKMGDVVTAYLAELRDAGEDLVTVACVVTSARKHITKNKQLMLFAQVEDLTGSAEVTVFPRTYEATHPVWKPDEVILVLARVEQREDAPQLLCEHAVLFDDAGIAEIRARMEERRTYLARRQRFGERGNGRGAARAGNVTGNGGRAETAARSRGAEPPAPAGGANEVVIRFREALDYERSIALFQRIQVVLAANPGRSAVVLELPRAGGGLRRVPTSFRTQASPELRVGIERAVGDVVEVVTEESSRTPT